LADATEARTLIRRLNERYEKVGRAFRIEEVGGGFEMLTKPQFAPWLRRLGHVPPEERLTAAGMEVLAIIAYRQPVMRADIEAIRGVSSEEVLKQLLSRDLVRISGRSEELGRPYLYGTTKRFLKMFGLKSLEKLPRADWINETWDVEELPDESSGIQEGGNHPGSPTLFSSHSMNNNGFNGNRASSETSQGLQELQDLVDNRISEKDTRTDSKVNSVDLQPGTDTKESIVKLANSAIGLAFESEENLEEQLAVASRLASIPVAVDEDEDEDFEDDDEEYEDEEDEDFEEYEDEEDEELDEDIDEDFEDEDESEDDESFEDEEEDEWEEVDEEDDESEEDEEDEDWDDEDDDDWDDDDEEEEEEEEDWE
jgi:segregation and condensation protein B